MTVPSYEDLAVVMGLADVVIYAALIVIVVRRMHIGSRRGLIYVEPVASHARRVEGPVVSLFLVASVVVLVLAMTSGALHDEIVHLAVGALRGALLVLGSLTMLAYWELRDTWLR
jgi:hypothetical protein